MSASSASHRANHELFRAYPLAERNLSIGRVTAPYQIYDGSILFIGGTANLAAVKALLDDQQMHPLQTEDDKALMAIWVCDFTDANLGPHQELQVSFFVSETPMLPVPSGAFTILKLVSLNPDVQMLCHGLWNNTEKVVAYNRELLSLDAHLTNGTIQSALDQPRTTFRFVDAQSDRLLVEGQVTTPRSQRMRDMFALMRSLGWSNSMKMARMPYLTLKVINPLSELAARHMVAQTYARGDKQVTNVFDPNVDHIQLSDIRYHAVQFIPHFINRSSGIRFLYLDPVAMTEKHLPV